MDRSLKYRTDWQREWGLDHSAFYIKLEGIIELSCDPAISPLDIYPKELKSEFQKSPLHFRVHCSITHNNQGMKQTKCLLTDKWKKKK